MNYETLKIFKKEQLSLDKEIETGKYCLSIPVRNGCVDYEEYFEISDVELDLFMNNTDLLIKFANECILHKHDERLMERPGSLRGGRRIIDG